MKGFIFLEYLEFVKHHFTASVYNRVLKHCHGERHGAYIPSADYDHDEFQRLIDVLSGYTSESVDRLMVAFGQELFIYFKDNFPEVFAGSSNTHNFLTHMQDCSEASACEVFLEYAISDIGVSKKTSEQKELERGSTVPLESLAEGLIIGCIEYYRSNMDLVSEYTSDDSGTETKFVSKQRKAKKLVA